jgi:hypothetical protein
MRKTIINLTILALVFSIPAFWPGCSESPIIGTSSSSQEEMSVSNYFPLGTGGILDFVVINNARNDTAYIRYSLCGQFDLGSQTFYIWESHNIDYPDMVDTGFLSADDQRIYFYESEYSRPEVVLEEPFEVGRIWRRYGGIETVLDLSHRNDTIWQNDYYYKDFPNDNSDDGLSDYDPYGDDPTGGAAKNYPTLGSNYFKISGIEDIVLESGGKYSKCLKVENATSRFSNYYWYAPDAGLVKYIIGVNGETYPEGEIIGERILRRPF